MGRAHLFSLSAVLTLGACSVVGPLTDRDLSKAPEMACTRLPAVPDSPQCLTLFRRGTRGETLPVEDGRLVAGDRLFATRSGEAACQGAFDNLLVVGDTAGPGRLRLGFADAIGRGDMVENYRWNRPRAQRRWVLRDVDTPYHIPGTARIELVEGEVQLRQVCVGGY